MSDHDYDMDVPPATMWTRILSRAEVWIYELNEQNHWIFRLYDAFNEFWARLVFRGVRARAANVDTQVEGRGVSVHMRLLSPADSESFAELLETLAQHKYRPPHALDRAAAVAALRRRSFLPFGIWDDERLVGYYLVRLFFPKRAATGVWMLSRYHSAGLGRAGIRVTGAFTRAEGLDDYITVPLDNISSLKGALGGGWRIVRSNRRFYVLLRE